MFQRLLFPFYSLFSTLNYRFSLRFTQEGKFCSGLLFASAVIGIDTRQTLAYQIFTLLLAIFLCSFFYSLFFRGNFRVKRTLPQYATAGKTFTYKIDIETLGNKQEKGLEIIEVLRDQRPTLNEFLNRKEPDEQQRNIFDRIFLFYRWVWLMNKNSLGINPKPQAVALLPGNVITVSFEVTASLRGKLEFQGIYIARKDPFGLFRALIKISQVQSMLVLPERFIVPNIPMSGGRKDQLGGVTLASSVGDSEEFYSMRDYVHGDPVRNIDWKSWAKTGKPIIREYQEEFFSRKALILDTYSGEKGEKNFEIAVSIAASYVVSIEDQESLLDLMFVEEDVYCFTSGRNTAHKSNALELLAGVVPSNNTAFPLLSGSVKKRSSILNGIICVFSHWDKERKELIQFLQSSGSPLKVFLVVEEDEKNKIDSKGLNITIIGNNSIRECLLNK
ncbi:MAG: DUF58 domain-containing protein [Nitrospinae bacterium]|nr:DUF58 domain-containing protein [Nitrospinota bacterium]